MLSQRVFSAIHNAFAMTTEEPSLKCQFMCVFPFKNDQNAVVSELPTVILKLIRVESTFEYSYFMLLLKKYKDLIKSNQIYHLFVYFQLCLAACKILFPLHSTGEAWSPTTEPPRNSLQSSFTFSGGEKLIIPTKERCLVRTMKL